MFPQTQNFENISVNIYETGSFTKFDERDPDANFFDDMTKSNFETSYFKSNEEKPHLWSTQYLERLNVLHVNIQSIERNFENLKADECELVCNIICVSETWCSNTELQNSSNLSLAEFDSTPYERSKTSRRGGGVLIFIKKNLSYKIRKDLSESDEHKEILFLEMSHKNSSNILLSCCYKSPNSDDDILSMFLKQVFGDLKINCWEYFENEKVSTFYNSLFEYGSIALTNKPARVGKKSANIIDNVTIANIFHKSLKKGITKSNRSDHVPIFFSISTSKSLQNSSPLKLKKRFFNENNVASFKDHIRNINWNNLNSTPCSVNSLYSTIHY